MQPAKNAPQCSLSVLDESFEEPFSFGVTNLPKNWWARRVRVSALQRKVAYLALKAKWKWNEVENICQRLTEEWQRPPLIALLLPATACESAWPALEGLSDKVVIEGFAETIYCGEDVCLWVLRWAADNLRTDPPAITLELFASHVTAAMAKFHRRDSGPFLWPLHDKDIASAIAMCEYVGVDAPWWRKLLWALRIVQPPGGTVLEECILDHYGREVGYVFAWANLFTRSLWVLTILCLFFYICGAQAQLGGYQGVLWYAMQICILGWAICLNALAGSRKSVLRSGGGGGFTNFRAQNNRTNEVPSNKVAPADSDHCRPQRGPDEKPIIQGAKTTALDGVQREAMVTSDAAEWRLRLPAATTHTWHDRRESLKDSFCPARLMEGVEEVPQERRPETAEKLQRALLKAKFLGWESKQLKVRRLNPDYSESRCPKVWAILAFSVTLAVMLFFLFTAILILFFFLNLKSHLIYVWGDCLRQGCNNPVQVHGLAGFLADISADISLALVFVVLGEVCKGLASQLAKLWNFKYMRQRQYVQAMLSLGIEVLAKVGVFSLIAFVFLPGWISDAEKEVVPNVQETCSRYVDYKICTWMSECSEDDQFCCAGSLLCAKDLLTFEQRRDLFHLWLIGPFLVCPFVDMIPAILAPLIAKRLSRWADNVSEKAQAVKRRLWQRCLRAPGWFCCCCCGKPLSRLLALIFVLDGEVTGLRYVCQGQTFATTELDTTDKSDADDDCCERCIDGPLEQVVLREFDALDELKDLKLNFLFVVLKLFLVRRRSFPRDAHLIHSTQETFTDVVTSFTVFWYLGLSLVTFNNELHTWTLPALLLTWLGCGLLGSIVVSLVVRFLRKRLE
eukprot:s2112_g27.t2